MSEAGNLYKTATEQVLKTWETEPDEHGRSQTWKIQAMREDREAGKYSGIIKTFVDKIEELVNQMEKMKPAAVEAGKNNTKSGSRELIAVEPIIPHS